MTGTVIIHIGDLHDQRQAPALIHPHCVLRIALQPGVHVGEHVGVPSGHVLLLARVVSQVEHTPARVHAGGSVERPAGGWSGGVGAGDGVGQRQRGVGRDARGQEPPVLDSVAGAVH